MRSIVLIGMLYLAGGPLSAVAQTSVTRESGAVVAQPPLIGQAPPAAPAERDRVAQAPAPGSASPDVMDLAIAAMRAAAEADADAVRDVAEDVRMQNSGQARDIPQVDGAVCVANCPPKH